jgi:ADP-ribose pyrophosphatase YjhB (NUDIX family)
MYEALKYQNRKRYRATLVIFRDNKVLLVRDKGKKDYSFPGGGFKHGENTIQAGMREVSEELRGINILSIERLRNCDFEGQRAKHKVCKFVIDGEPTIRQNYELDNLIWWDTKSNVPVQGHVKYILSKLT